MEGRERDVQRAENQGLQPRAQFQPRQQNLAAVLVILNLLAFTSHTALDRADRLWKAARRKLVTRQGVFGTLRNLTTDLLFSSWEDFRLPRNHGRQPHTTGARAIKNVDDSIAPDCGPPNRELLIVDDI